MTSPRDKDSYSHNQEDYRHIQEKTKMDKIGKLKRELEILEINMQRVKTKLQKLQDPTLTASMSMIGIRP